MQEGSCPICGCKLDPVPAAIVAHVSDSDEAIPVDSERDWLCQKGHRFAYDAAVLKPQHS